MTKDEALTMALEQLEFFDRSSHQHGYVWQKHLITAIKEALAQPEFLSNNEANIAQLIEERDVREYILDKVLDMVLGTDRPEWSSRYQYIDAVEDVRAALAQPYPEYDRGFSNGWDKCAERQATQPVQPEHPEQMARLGWQYVECPACGSEGARAFPKPEEQQSCDKQEPVEYQMRMRPTWEATSWSDWKKCSRDAAGDYAKTPKLHDWEYETRKLYAQPITQAIPQIPQIPQKDSSNEKRNNFLNGYCVGQADLLAEQAKQEPAAWMVYTQDGQSVYVTDNPTDIQKGQRALPLYTSPPQRQPLTEEKQIAEDLRFHGLQLVKTVTGYAVLKLGQVAAHNIKEIK